MSDVDNTVETSTTNPRRWLRNLRIAVSMFFGVITVALCVLWAGSYSRTYNLNNVSDGNFVISVASSQGEFRLFFGRRPNPGPVPMQMNQGWYLLSSEGEGKAKAWPKFAWGTIPQATIATVPQWFLILLSTAVAVLPWLSSRFSLRTLLIATTLAAVVLGLGVWLTR